MGQVSAVSQILSHDGITGLQHSELNGHIGLGAGMGLYIHVFTAEDFFRALDGQLFHLIHAFTAAVITFSGISFRVFIGQRASHGSHYGFGYPVFRCD